MTGMVCGTPVDASASYGLGKRPDTRSAIRFPKLSRSPVNRPAAVRMIWYGPSNSLSWPVTASPLFKPSPGTDLRRLTAGSRKVLAPGNGSHPKLSLNRYALSLTGLQPNRASGT